MPIPIHSVSLGITSTTNTNPLSCQLTSLSPNHDEQDDNFQAELDATIEYNMETRPIHAWLDGIKVFV